MILDTTVLIDLMHGEHAAEEKIKSLIEQGIPLAVTTINIFELFSGVAQCSKPALERERINRVLSDQVRWQLDEASAERGGLVHGELAKHGLEIDPEDAMIAGIALQRREPVLTRNVKDFSRVAGLKVESY